MRHIRALDGVRGIAILLVLAFHTQGVGRLAEFGWSGVDLFFVLSGFLITGILVDSANEPRRAKRFYIRRALRILPLSYGAIIVALVASPRLAAQQGWLWTYTANIPMGLEGAQSADSIPLLSHFWSLAIEEQFYLIWPFVVWHTSRRTAIRIAWVVIVVALACRVTLFAAGAPWATRYFLTPCRLDALAVGSLVALWPRDRVEQRMRWAGLAAGLVIAAIIVHERGFPNSPGLVDTIGYSAVAWFFGWLVTVAALQPARLLQSAPLVIAGRYSYGLYVIHPLVAAAIVAQWPSLAGGLRCGALMWIGSWALALVSYHGYERWFLRLKERPWAS